MPPSRMDQGLDQNAQQDTSPEKNAAANAAPRFYHFSDVGVLFATPRLSFPTEPRAARACTGSAPGGRKIVAQRVSAGNARGSYAQPWQGRKSPRANSKYWGLARRGCDTLLRPFRG